MKKCFMSLSIHNDIFCYPDKHGKTKTWDEYLLFRDYGVWGRNKSFFRVVGLIQRHPKVRCFDVSSLLETRLDVKMIVIEDRPQQNKK